MDLTFVYESNHPILVEDGLTKALDLLGQTIKIKRINLATQELKPEGFILGHGAFGSRVDKAIKNLPNKKGLCIGGCTPPEDSLNYDILFYETKWYREQIKFHPNIIHAFGINTSVYSNMEIDRDIDYLGVGAFAKWKRWEKFLDKKGVRRVIGEFQKNNPLESQHIWDLLEKDGVVCKDMIPAHLLALEYNRAKTVYISASIMGGGERAVLEARACGCKVLVENDNPKLQELITSPIYDHNYYFNQLKTGYESCI